MYNTNRASDESARIHDRSCSCEKCKRTSKYKELLDRLTSASKMVDYEEQIYTTVSMICTVDKKNFIRIVPTIILNIF